MKIEELKILKKGSEVYWQVDKNTYQHGTFEGLIEVTKFGTMSLSDLIQDKFGMSKGKKCLEAKIKYADDHGRIKTDYISTRKVRKEIL